MESEPPSLNRYSILQYARSHNLTQDHTLENDSQAGSILQLLSPPQNTYECYQHPAAPSFLTSHDTHLSRDFPINSHIQANSNENLGIDFATASLLRSSIQAPAAPSSERNHDDSDEEILMSSNNSRLPRKKRLRLKLDTPLLKTDHELDVLKFRTSVRNARSSGIGSFRPEQIDDEADEGLAWPAKYTSLPRERDEAAHKAKLSLQRDGAMLLKSITTREGLSKADIDSIVAEEVDPSEWRKQAPVPISPPLLSKLPGSEGEEEGMQSSPLNAFEPFSEASHSTRAELEAIEMEIFEQDIMGDGEPVKEPGSPCFLPSMESPTLLGSSPNAIAKCSSSPTRLRAADLKVDGPLTPPTMTIAQHPNVESFSDEIRQCFPVFEKDKTRSSGTALVNSSDELMETFFRDTIEPAAIKVKNDAEQERPQEAGLTKRVDVPALGFTNADPPWKTCTDSRQNRKDEANMSSLMLPIANMKLHHWPGVAKLDLRMKWKPFPSELGQVATKETISESNVLPQFIDSDRYKSTISIDSLTWKPEGLRLLAPEDGDDDEIEPALIEGGNDMESLIRKRKREFDDEEEERSNRGRTNMNTIVEDKKPTAKDIEQDLEKRQGATTNLQSSTGNFFSTTGRLGSFLETQGREYKRTRLTQPLIPTRTPEPIRSTEVQRTTEAKDSKQGSGPVSHDGPLPFPVVEEPMGACPTVVSSKLLQQQKTLIRHLMKLVPELELVERDWALRLNASQRDGKGQFRQYETPKQSISLADEGDVLISPRTGIICTNLQKLKQKPPPGQGPTEPFIRQRIAIVAPRYEHLTVLVCSSDNRNAEDMTVLGDRDCQDLFELIAFTAGLQDDVQVHFVGGGDAGMARWIVGLMASPTSAIQREHVKLLADETLWELFLRRAGMNTYAAQVVLSSLKGPEDGAARPPSSIFEGQDATHPSFGLTAFVAMTREERMHTFERVLGGRKLLCRVSDLIDVEWPRSKRARKELGI